MPCFCVHLVSLLLVRTNPPSAAHLNKTMAALPSIGLLHSFTTTLMGHVGLDRVEYKKTSSPQDVDIQSNTTKTRHDR